MTSFARPVLWSSVLVASALAGCSGSSGGGPPPVSTATTPAAVTTTAATSVPTTNATLVPTQPPFSATPTGVPTATGTPPPVGPASPQSIYLADIASGTVLIYASGSSGAVSPSAVIGGSNTGLTDPSGASPIYGAAVDAAGNVYVLTQTSNTSGMLTAETIDVFAAGTDGNVAPTRTISLPLSIDAEALASDDGMLYVTDDSGSGAIAVYPSTSSGAATASAVFSPSGGFAEEPFTVAFDTSGDPYVATYDPSAMSTTEAQQGVYVFPAGSNGSVAATELTGTATGFGNGSLFGATVDASNRIDVVLADQKTETTADLDEFAAGSTGNTAAATAFQDASSEGPFSIATDATNAVYVGEITDTSSYAQVNVFAPGATAPSRTIQAHDASVPLVVLGPYVAPDASGSLAARSRSRLSPASVRALRASHHRRSLMTTFR